MVTLSKAMSEKDIYLNAYHRRQHEQARTFLSRRPKQSLAEAMRQYDRIKRGSTRMRPQFASAMKGGTK